MSEGGENERTGCDGVVTLEVVAETEDVEVVLDTELDLEVVGPPNNGDRIPERIPGMSVVAGVAGAFLSFGGVGGVGVGCVGGVGGVGGSSKKSKGPYN